MFDTQTISKLFPLQETDTAHADEVWLPIVDFAGYYISSLGRVFSERSNKLLNYGLSHGYPRIVLRREGKTFYRELHTLLALTFIGQRPAGADIRHLDGNPLNFSLNNLAYGSRTQNIADGAAQLRYPRPGKPGTILDHDKACAIFVDPRPAKVIAGEYGVKVSMINAVRSRRSWKHATKDLVRSPRN